MVGYVVSMVVFVWCLLATHACSDVLDVKSIDECKSWHLEALPLPNESTPERVHKS